MSLMGMAGAGGFGSAFDQQQALCYGQERMRDEYLRREMLMQHRMPRSADYHLETLAKIQNEDNLLLLL